MAGKIRVHELAKELGVPASTLLRRLREQGEFVKSASSTIEAPLARRLRDATQRGVGIEPGAGRRAVTPPADPHPVPSMYGWNANPVKEPTAPEVLDGIAQLGRLFPEAIDHLDALRRLGSQMVHASTGTRQLKDCGIALVRFSGAVEAAFGLTREVLVVYTPYRDLQVRTFQNAKETLRTMHREATPDLIFVCAPDPRIGAKLEDWSASGFLAIPLRSDEEMDAMSFITRIRDYVYSRDLFYETTPVKGGQFFGRKTLLQTLRDDVKRQRVAGIFGLRKAGKTSVLYQLSADLESTRTIPLLLDLEAFPAPPDDDPIPHIIEALSVKLVDELQSRNLRTSEIRRLNDRASIPQFKTVLTAALKRLENEDYGLLLLLDEIEFLTPADRIDVAEGPMPQIAQFLGALRSVVQECKNFTFILSGLTSAILENGRLYGRPNPLFSWAKSHYVGPLTRDDADHLATTIGAKMGIEIENSALRSLYDASGGHAFLYRNLASTVVGRLPIDIFRRRITNSDVLYALAPWKGEISGNIAEMIDHVKRYYSTEALLLDALSEDYDTFSEFAQEYPQALSHLLSLGLVRPVDNRYEINSLLELL